MELTREDLHELIWSIPMISGGEKLSVSDVAAVAARTLCRQ